MPFIWTYKLLTIFPVSTSIIQTCERYFWSNNLLYILTYFLKENFQHLIEILPSSSQSKSTMSSIPLIISCPFSYVGYTSVITDLWYMCACMYVYLYMHVYVYKCTNVYICISTCVYVYMYECMLVCVFMRNWFAYIYI